MKTLFALAFLSALNATAQTSFYSAPDGRLVGVASTYGNTTFVTDASGRLQGTAITIPSYTYSPQPVAPLPVPSMTPVSPMPAMPMLPPLPR